MKKTLSRKKRESLNGNAVINIYTVFCPQGFWVLHLLFISVFFCLQLTTSILGYTNIFIQDIYQALEIVLKIIFVKLT